MIHHTPIARYCQWGLDSFPTELRNLFQCFLNNPRAWIRHRRSVLLWGPEGTGKSCIMGAVHQALAEQRRLVYWVDCAAWTDNYTESDEAAEDLSSSRTEIVLWDDLGKEPANTRGDVRDIIFARHKMARGVNILTTNLNLSSERDKCELTEKYGASLRSRLREMCGDHIICYEGMDRRMGV